MNIMNVAQTILSQIKQLDPSALFAWGAKDLTNIGTGLQFKTSGMTPWKGFVKIIYNEGQDLYEIEFFRIRKSEIKVDKKVTEVYAEDMIGIIDAFVG
jgi:hypothetical protein